MRAIAAVTALTAAILVSVSVPAGAAESEDNYIAEQTNAYRIAQGLPALASYSSMDWVPESWSKTMRADRDLKHNPNFSSQLPQKGLSRSGENVAYACGYGGKRANSAVIMREWKKSSGHRANMLGSAYTHLSVGTAYNSSTDCVWATQNFATYAAGTAPALNTGTGFSDVLSNSQFADEIMWLAASGITTGYADGTFRPKDEVSREAFAAFLYRSAGSPTVSVPSRSPFKDVSTSAPFYKEIVWLSQQGITTGYADGTFRPKNEISREAMAAFLYRFHDTRSFTAPKSSPFTDMKTSSQFYKEVTWLRSTGITTGYADGTFRPSGSVTREATAAFFMRM